MGNNQQVKCIRCGRVKSVSQAGGLYYCSHCGIQFDDDPDEGGDYGHRPSARLEREERREQQRRERLKRGR